MRSWQYQGNLLKMSSVKRITIMFVIWRLLLFIPLLLAPQFLALRPGYAYTIAPNPWANFDGIHYLSIAAKGYNDNGRFFPLYPLAIRFLSLTTAPQMQFITAFIIANGCFLLSLLFLYKLLKLDYKESIVWQTILLLIVFPTAFFFASIYSESLFLLLSILSFYFTRKKQWLLASISAIGLTLTRPVGLIILPVLLVEFIKSKEKLSRLIPLLFIPAGIISYMWFNFQKWGDAFYFLRAQAQLANSRTTTSIVLFPQTLYRYGKILTTVPASTYEWWVASLELSVFIVITLLLYQCWQKKIKFSYLLYAFLGFLIPVSTGTFTGLPRYVIVLFPVFLALALTKNVYYKWLYIIFSVVISFILLALFSRGYYVA